MAAKGKWRRIAVTVGIIMMSFLLQSTGARADCEVQIQSMEVISGGSTFSATPDTLQEVVVELELRHVNRGDEPCTTVPLYVSFILAVDGQFSSCPQFGTQRILPPQGIGFDRLICSMTWLVPPSRTTVEISVTATSALPNRTVTRTLTARATQAITFDQELSGRVGDVIALSASGGGSGEPVTFASATPDVCSTGGANGATLTLQAASTCEVRARQAGNVNFEAAPETARSFAVEKGVQASLVFTPKSPIVFGEEVTLAASGGDGIGAVTFAVVDGGAYCAVSGNTLTATGADGACTVRASKAGDANYEGTSEDAVVTVSPRQAQAELSIVGGPLSFPGSLTLSVTGGTTSGAVTYELLSGPCTLAGAVLSSTGIGTCTVRATMAGSGGYLEVVSAALGVTVSRNRVVEEAARRMQQAMLAKGRAMLSYNPGADRMAAGKRSGPSVAVLPQGDSRQGSIAFATSLREIAQAAEKGDRHVVPTAADRPDALPDPVPRAAGSLDLWADGRIVWFDSEDDGDSQRGFLGEVGIDYLITEALLLGVSLRLDETSGDDEDSRGWMVGPYAVAEVAPGLRLDGRLLWGRGSGDLGIGLSGVTYEGDYESTRWLAEAGVRGEIDLAPVALEPGLRVSWWREEADRYSLSNGGGSVEDQELSLLRIALDPRLSYSTTTQGSLMASPYLKPQLIAEWQDQKGNGEGWDIFGAVEAGLSVSGPSYSFGARVEASGLGSDQGRSFGAGAELSIPLN